MTTYVLNSSIPLNNINKKPPSVLWSQDRKNNEYIKNSHQQIAFIENDNDPINFLQQQYAINAIPEILIINRVNILAPEQLKAELEKISQIYV